MKINRKYCFCSRTFLFARRVNKNNYQDFANQQMKDENESITLIDIT